MSGDRNISIKEAVEKLRSDLQEASRAAKGQELTFKLEDIELELQVGVERSASGNGGINWWIVNLGSELEQKSVRYHTIKLHLNAGDIEVSDPQNRTK